MRTRTGSTPRERFDARLLGLIAVLSALVAQPLPALAQEPGAPERWVLFLQAATDRSVTDLCVGDIVNIDVQATRILANQRVPTVADARPAAHIPGVKIQGSVDSPGVGSLNPTERITTAEANPPGSARFVFQATNRGTASIGFKGTEVQRTWAGQPTGIDVYLPTEVEMTVNDCDYVVFATHLWHVGGAAVGWDYEASVGQLMTADEPGHYTGTGTWQLIKTENPGVRGCPTHSRVYGAPVTLVGQVEGDQLRVEVDYHPVRVNWATTGSRDVMNCAYPYATEIYGAAPETLTFSVPLAGASLTVPQTLTTVVTGPLSNGTTQVTVERVVPE